MRYYIYAEDFAAALIGPFDTCTAAYEHVVFCQERGDCAEMRVLDEEQVEDFRPRCGIFLTAVQDVVQGAQKR